MNTCYRLAGVIAMACVFTGCAAFSASMMLSGKSPALDENARVEKVPQPGFTEQLTVVFHPTGLPVARTYKTHRNKTGARKPAPSTRQPLKPAALACVVDQQGFNIEYTAATHYGKRWKWATALFFAAEATAAAVYLLSDAPDGESNVPRRIGGALFAVDALGTAGLFFMPKRDVLKTRQRQVTTRVRTDCPAGLVVDIDGKRVEVGSNGTLALLGPELLDRAMATPSAQVAIHYGTQTSLVSLSPGQRCTWLRRRRLSQQAVTVCRDAAGTGRRAPITTTMDVSPGTFSAGRDNVMNRVLSLRPRR